MQIIPSFHKNEAVDMGEGEEDGGGIQFYRDFHEFSKCQTIKAAWERIKKKQGVERLTGPV